MNWLKNKPQNTELMYIASWWQIRICVENSIRVGLDMVGRSVLIKLIGTWLDEKIII